MAGGWCLVLGKCTPDASRACPYARAGFAVTRSPVSVRPGPVVAFLTRSGIVVVSLAALMKKPLTGDDPGYEYVKPADGAPAETTVIRYQLRDGKRDESLPKYYLSGVVR